MNKRLLFFVLLKGWMPLFILTHSAIQKRIQQIASRKAVIEVARLRDCYARFWIKLITGVLHQCRFY